MNRSKRCFNKPVKKPSQKISKKTTKKYVRVGSHLTSIVYRTLPGPLASVMSSLTLSQKKVLCDLRLGSLIGFNIFELPTKLVYYVVDSFDMDDMVIRTSMGDIKCDENAVFDAFGIRKGSVGLGELGNDADSEFIEDWYSQFDDRKNIRNGKIADVINNKKGATDFTFKINFLILFWNSMICSDSSGLVKVDVLKRVSRETKLSDIDWCGHMLHELKFSKNKWNREFPERRPYCGPATLLTVSFFVLFICYVFSFYFLFVFLIYIFNKFCSYFILTVQNVMVFLLPVNVQYSKTGLRTSI